MVVGIIEASFKLKNNNNNKIKLNVLSFLIQIVEYRGHTDAPPRGRWGEAANNYDYLLKESIT